MLIEQPRSPTKSYRSISRSMTVFIRWLKVTLMVSWSRVNRFVLSTKSRLKLIRLIYLVFPITRNTSRHLPNTKSRWQISRPGTMMRCPRQPLKKNGKLLTSVWFTSNCHYKKLQISAWSKPISRPLKTWRSRLRTLVWALNSWLRSQTRLLSMKRISLTLKMILRML